ncbi:GNAT family N-acetyltransferase [Aspergillus lucknowensis]|uniref:Acyl-CoA N-acyltransferase n=1 Tax=Aspergillus lucknowensis TaxID=176173 RepID=A0ABR4M0Q6_9EURO
MNIQIRYANPADAPKLAEINIQSFSSQGFFNNVFGSARADVVHALKHARYLQKLAHPQTHVLAAVDEHSGAIVGCARWVFPRDQLARQAAEAEEDRAGPELPEGTNREAYEGFFNILTERGRPHRRDDDILLEYLACRPESQGKGVGKALLRWGMERADREQRRIYLEASTEGFPVYAKLGWKELEKVEVDYTRLGGKGKQVLTLMVRDPLPYSSG